MAVTIRTSVEVVQSRIRARLEALGMSARAASLAATRQPDAINNIINKNAMPNASRLAALAEVLETNVGYLVGTTEDTSAHGDAPVVTAAAVATPPQIPDRIDMLKDIPVYGTALGGEMTALDAPTDGTPIEMTDLNSAEVIDFLRRPPSLERNRKVYGLYVVGTSMDPVFESGSAIVVEPSRPPSVRDFVVVYLRDRDSDEDGNMSAVLIKRLVRRSASFVELEQYNPAGTFRLPAADVKAMHRVLSITEMLGA